MTTRYQRLYDGQVGTALSRPGNLELAACASERHPSSCRQPRKTEPVRKSTPAPPLYPDYLPSRPENFSRAQAHPSFEAFEVGLRAAPELPVLRRAIASAVDRPGRLEHLTPRIGSELFGVQLSDLDAAGLDEVALLAAQRGVVVFRGQTFKDLGIARQLAIGRHFGPLHRHPTQGYPKEVGHSEMQVIYTDPEAGSLRDYLGPRLSYQLWHNDQTWEEHTPSVSIMAALELPAGGGGDTVFSSLTAAYSALSPAFAATLDGLELEHYSLSLARAAELGYEGSRTEGVVTTHPLVIRHPVTGEKALYLSPTSAWSVVGFLPAESAHLLDFLHRHIESLDLTCRVKWEIGTVVVWDQRAVAHSAVPDYSSEGRRHLIRMLPLGTRPQAASAGDPR